MGLLNYLFGTKHHVKRLEMDERHRLKVWQEHLANINALGKLAERFLPKDVDRAANAPELQTWLLQIEQTISHELIEIDDEQRTDEEILQELVRLKRRRHFAHITSIARDKESSIEQRHNAVLDLMRITHDQLSTVIKIIRQLRHTNNPDVKKRFLQELFRIIYHDMLIVGYRFREENTKPEVYLQVQSLCKSILADEQCARLTEKTEERFATAMLCSMLNEKSKHEWRMIGESIFSELLGTVDGKLPNGDFHERREEFERLVDDEAILTEAVGKIVPGKIPEWVKSVVKAFQQSYHAGGFETLEQYF